MSAQFWLGAGRSSDLPVSSSVFRPLSTQLQPPPAPVSSISPASSAASFGAPWSSWITVSFVMPPLASPISYVSRVKPSASISASITMRNDWTSFRGGSASMTSPSMPTSGAPVARIARS